MVGPAEKAPKDLFWLLVLLIIMILIDFIPFGVAKLGQAGIRVCSQLKRVGPYRLNIHESKEKVITHKDKSFPNKHLEGQP